MADKKFTPYAVDTLPTTNIDLGGIYYIRKDEENFTSYIRNNENTKWLKQVVTEEFLANLIDDGVVSEEFVWSSFKVNEELGSKQDVFTTEGGLELDNALLKLKLRTEDLRIDENEELAVQLTAWSPLTFYKNKKIEHQGATEES